MRIIAAMVLGLALGCAAWGLGGRGEPAGLDAAQRVFTARYQARVRLGEGGPLSLNMPHDTCGACLEVCREMGEGYADCAARCALACGLSGGPADGRSGASAWADAR